MPRKQRRRRLSGGIELQEAPLVTPTQSRGTNKLLIFFIFFEEKYKNTFC